MINFFLSDPNLPSKIRNRSLFIVSQTSQADLKEHIIFLFCCCSSSFFLFFFVVSLIFYIFAHQISKTLGSQKL